jgi:predicted nicotinamide N-methyase
MPDGDDRIRRSPSAEANPFDAFIGQACEEGDVSTKSLIPQQIPSIIDERAIVRYYIDGSKSPIIISDGHQGTAKQASEDNEGDHYDVALALDVTTGCGGKIWPAAEVLGAYIASRRTAVEWKGKVAVELGAGTGLVGLLAAQMNILHHVWITDQIPMMRLMQQNLDLNGEQLRKCCTVAELNWGERVPADTPSKPDILLLADCVYLEVAFQPLVDTMCEMSTPETEILFCYQQRRKADKRFFKMLRKHFHFTDIEDDDPVRKQTYNRQGTHLYRIVKK